MAEKGTYLEFRELLRKAIGERRTQAEFAAQAGITPQHLNKLLNSETISRPTRETLIKVSGAAERPIPLKAFLAACGYEENSQAQEALSRLSVKERIKRFCDLVKSGCEELCGGFYGSVYDFADAVVMLFSEEDVSILAGEPLPVQSGEVKNAENVSVVSFSFAADGYAATLDAGVFYTETKSGRVIILDTAFNQGVLKKYESRVVMDITAAGLYNGDHIACSIRIKRPQGDLLKKYPTPERRLLLALFGEDESHYKRIEGTGMYLDNLTIPAIKRFLREHAQTFSRTDREKDILGKVLDGSLSPEEAFVDYKCDAPEYAGGGIASVIANIISRETGLTISCWNKTGEDQDKNRTCIMFRKRYPWEYSEMEKALSRETLGIMLDNYARQLRTEVEECVYNIFI